MFAFIIVLSWVLVIIGVVLTMVFGALTIVTQNGDPAHTPDGMKDIGKFLSKDLLGINDNVIAKNLINGHNTAGIWILPIIEIVVGGLFIFMAIIEFIRIRKHQRIAKPIVRFGLVISAILLILFAKLLFLIAAILFVTALLLQEIVLFDTEALNNYAEERNLISIYREEKKFEKEVSKEGKLTGNIDSVASKVHEVENSNMSDLDEKVKISDNAMLPNENEEIKYSDIEGPVNEPDTINNKKYQRYLAQWKLLKQQLDKFRTECYSKAAELDEKGRAKLQAKFNQRAEKINVIARELKLADSFMESFIDLNNAPNEELKQENINLGDGVPIETPSPSVAPIPSAFEEVMSKPTEEVTTIKSQSAIEQATTTFKDGPSSMSVDLDVENIHQMHSTADETFVAPNAGTISSAPTPDAAPQTFVIPTTQGTEQIRKRADDEKRNLEIALKTAVRMDFDMLPLSNASADADLNVISNDLGIFVETHDVSYGSGNTKIVSTPTPAPEFAHEEPSFDTKVTAPPTFSFDDEPKIAHSNESDTKNAAPQTFVIPTTQGTTQINKSREMEQKMIQAALKDAIHMDFSMLPTSAQPADAELHTIEKDMGFHVETHDASYNTQQIHEAVAELGTKVDTKPIPGVDVAVHTSPSVEPAPATPIPPMAPVPPTSNPEVAAKSVIDELHDLSANNAAEANDKIDQIERRMENIERMIQTLAASQKNAAPTGDQGQVDELRSEFSRIEEQLARISRSFEVNNREENESKSLYSALIRGYKYNNNK